MDQLAQCRALLTKAGAVLRHEVLPFLPSEKLSAGLLVAAALATVEGQAQSGQTGSRWAAVRERFAALYGRDAVGTDRDWLRAVNRRLALDIREGRFDQDPDGAVRAVVMEQLIARLAVANPRFPETGIFSRPGIRRLPDNPRGRNR